MILHVITGMLCLFLFGRMLFLFKSLGDKEKQNSPILKELLTLLGLTALLPFILSLFAH
ncbi:MAG: hypothetical protein LW818_10085 [Ignavibacteriae bacterium]|jgi:hypothetical protein|nr:hypothetical protein [Ignavibacteriota bacterium]